MRHGMRTDLEAAFGEVSKTVPVQRTEIGLARGRTAGQFPCGERSSTICESRAGKDGRRDTEALESRQSIEHTFEGIVERHVQQAPTAGDEVFRPSSAVATRQQELDLPLESARRDR